MRFLDLTLPALDANLALDEALLEAAEEGAEPILRLWEAPRLAVVLGASCRWREDVNAAACQADGVPVLRRSSGGGTVVLGPGALNAAVVLPIQSAPGLTAVDVAQRYVLERIAFRLRAMGRPVAVLGSGDLTLQHRKFAGSAQRRLRHHFLVHASILYQFPLDRISQYTHLPRRQPAYREGRAHKDFLINIDLDRTALVAALRDAWRAEGPPPAWPEARVRDLVATKFADPSWITRF
jgi:lipoate-protein ligase A